MSTVPRRSLRGSTHTTKVRTRPWGAIVDYYSELVRRGIELGRLLELVRRIEASTLEPELHGCTSMDALLLADRPDFALGDHMLRLQYFPQQREFEFRYHPSAPACYPVIKCVGLGAAEETIFLLLRYKFGMHPLGDIGE